MKGNSPVSMTPAISKTNFGRGRFLIYYWVKYCWVAFYTHTLCLLWSVGKLMLLQLFHPGDKLWQVSMKFRTNFNHRCVNEWMALKSLSPVSTTPTIKKIVNISACRHSSQLTFIKIHFLKIYSNLINWFIRQRLAFSPPITTTWQVVFAFHSVSSIG